MRATVLCENSVYGKLNALAEHGWSVWIETGDGNYLFDTGQGQTLRENARLLGIPLETAEGILISHHHIDHTGGLLDALGVLRTRTPRTVPVHAHPDLFKDSYAKLNDEGPLTFIGVPFTRSALEAAGADFRLETTWSEVGPGIYMTGEVARQHAFEIGDQHMFHRGATGELEVDPVRDDQTVVVETPEGLVVILGCSHAGLINILDYIVQQTGKDHFHSVIGGTHLGPVSEEQVTETITALAEFDIERLGTSHCTGPAVASRLAVEYGERFFFSSVGTTIQV